MEKKYVLLLCVAVIGAIGITVGITYSLWSSTSVQTEDNVVSTGCFEIAFTETSGSDINLVNAYPISDTSGMSTTPYQFTIENTCSLAADYTVSFEVAPNTTNGLSHAYLKATLDSNTPKVLTGYGTATATISGRTAYKLYTGKLSAEQSVTHTFRMWLDESATQDVAANKSLTGKIVVNSVVADQ